MPPGTLQRPRQPQTTPVSLQNNVGANLFALAVPSVLVVYICANEFAPTGPVGQNSVLAYSTLA